MSDSFTTPGTVARQVPVHGICRARILQWAALSFSGGSSRPGDGTRVSRVAGGFFPTEPPGKVPWKCAHVSKLKTAEFKRIQLTVLKITLQLFFNRTPVPATTEVTAHTKKGKKQKNKPKMKNAWVKSLFSKNGAVCRPGLTSPWPVFPFSARASGVGVEGGAEGWRRATHQTGDRKGWSTSVLREHATARAAKRWEHSGVRDARGSAERSPGPWHASSRHLTGPPCVRRPAFLHGGWRWPPPPGLWFCWRERTMDKQTQAAGFPFRRRPLHLWNATVIWPPRDWGGHVTGSSHGSVAYHRRPGSICWGMVNKQMYLLKWGLGCVG